MSTAESVSLAIAIVLAALSYVILAICRAAGRASERERAAEAAASAEPTDGGGDEWVYEGPDGLRLIEDTDRHLDVYADLTGLFERLGPAPTDLALHPDDSAGFDRLRQAIRDEQQKGD